MAGFRDALELCELVNLGFSGIPRTYDNKRVGAANVKVRMDLDIASNTWRYLYPYNSWQHIVTPCSDHVALLIRAKLKKPRLEKKV
jgi:hypothetical protein